MNGMRQVVEHVMGTYNVPGIALAVARGLDAPDYVVLGTDRDGVPLASDSLFPVMSITKLATSLAVLHLVDAGHLTLDDPLMRHIPESTVAIVGVTVRSLLTHTSGLPNWYDETNAQWTENLTWSSITQACLQTSPVAPPNTKVIYSNVGYSLLAVIVERVTSQPFATMIRQFVIEPLGIEAYLGEEPSRRVCTIFDSEREAERGTLLEWRNSAFFRSFPLPFGGLVTNLDGALGLIRAFMGQPTGLLRPETRSEAIRNQTGTLDGDIFNWSPCPWGLGPELRGAKAPHWTPEASADSFGHVGDSGCIVWTDPVRDTTWAIQCTRAVDGDWFFAAMPEIGAAILSSTLSIW